MKKYLVYFGLALCLTSAEASVLIEEEKASFSPQEIARVFASKIALEGEGSFYRRLVHAHGLIETHLGPYSLAYKEVSELRNLFETCPDDFQKISQRSLGSFKGKSLTLQNYLVFCMRFYSKPTQQLFTPYSGLSLQDTDVEVILNHFEFSPGEIDAVTKALSRRLKEYFKFPFHLSPSSIISFSKDFQDFIQKETKKSKTFSKEEDFYQLDSFCEGLKKKGYSGREIAEAITKRTFSKDLSSLTAREIAEGFLGMNYDEVQQFCQKVSLEKDHIWKKFVSRGKKNSNLAPDKNILLILQVFKDYPDDLKEVRNYVLWEREDQRLTLEEYLQFCRDVYPAEQKQLWIPFIQPQRYPDTEISLKLLGFRTNVQRDFHIRQLTRKAAGDFQNPFSMDVLKVAQFRKDFLALEKAVKEYQRPRFVLEEDPEYKIKEYAAWIWHHPLLTGTTSLLAGGVAYYLNS